MDRQFNTSYMADVFARAKTLGGLFNAHLHLDRAETLQATWDMLHSRGESSDSSLAIAQKHALIPMIHDSPCYDPDVLEQRVAQCLRKMARLGTTRAHSVVDVTTDRVGLGALERLRGLADTLRGEIDFRIGAYSPLGFRDNEPARWDLIERAAVQADFIGALPERDDRMVYPEHIGFDECCRRVMRLAFEAGKPLHIHVDQKNHDREDHSERVVRIVREEGFVRKGTEPFIWLIHVISPSAYRESRFATLTQNLAALNIGVICCPSAAISMQQLRPLQTPSHNSIARVLELLAAGVHLRLGTDNVCDITSPAGSLDVMDEVFVLCNAVRFYDPEVMACLAAGQRLSESARARVLAHLEEDRAQSARALEEYEAMATAGQEV